MMPQNFRVDVEPEIQAETYILLIQSPTSLFSTIVQATRMHIFGSYPPGASTLKYTIVHIGKKYRIVVASALSHAPGWDMLKPVVARKFKCKCQARGWVQNFKSL